MPRVKARGLEGRVITSRTPAAAQRLRQAANRVVAFAETTRFPAAAASRTRTVFRVERGAERGKVEEERETGIESMRAGMRVSLSLDDGGRVGRRSLPRHLATRRGVNAREPAK